MIPLQLPAHTDRTLVLASLAKDTELTCQILEAANIHCEPLSDLNTLDNAIEQGVSALIIGSEMLTTDILESLKTSLSKQQPWSDLAVIVLTGSGKYQISPSALRQVYEALHYVTILTRPILVSHFVSTVRGAVTGRRRLYDVRALMARHTQELIGRKSVEASLRQTLQELAKSKNEAEAANRAKTSFLANLSHELRTPLCAMLGFAELLKDPTLSHEDRISYVNIIFRNGHQLVTLIDDILDLSKIEAGHLQIEHLLVSLPILLSDISSSLTIKAREKGIQLSFESVGKIPESIISDPTRLRQILLNIIGNAIKFTDHGSVTVKVAHTIEPEPLGGRLTCTVEDTGCGIIAAAADKLFIPFSQADVSTTRKFGGTGLGLALSRRLARSLGGDVTLAATEQNKGSTFFVTVAAPIPKDITPLACEHPNAPTGTVPAVPALKPLTGVRVLLAEDAPDSQLLIERFLRIEGAEVDLAEDGAEAVKKATANHYDVILMDIQMPILDGYGATAALRGQGYLGPIIALTAHAMPGECEKSIRAGCDHHLIKPVDRKLLIQTVSRYSGQNIRGAPSKMPSTAVGATTLTGDLRATDQRQ
jgi:signal transduction histidine kinase/ActR/RegA family two-component response regulator